VGVEKEGCVAEAFLEGAPTVAVRTITGAGMDELRQALESAAREVAEKNSSGAFRLPIDRAFSAKGFGTVITGTLISGSVEREQEVELYPTGRTLRVRGVQVYGQPADRATAGQRTALNLADIEPAEIARGMVLSEAGRFRVTTLLDCRLELLPSAKPLKNRAPVHFHCGTAEIEAEVRPFQGATVIQPGQRAYARVVLREPALVLPGDRFIIRMFSPVVTIGGGVVVDISGLRYRKTDDVDTRLNVLAGTDVAASVALLVKESRYGMSFGDLVSRTGLMERDLETIARSPQFMFLEQPQRWLMDRAWFDALLHLLFGLIRFLRVQVHRKV